MAKKTITQEELIRKHLNKKGSITSWEAIMKYGCTRLSAYIYLLKKEGMNITSEKVCKKNRYGNIVCFSKYKRVR